MAGMALYVSGAVLGAVFEAIRKLVSGVDLRE